METYVSLWNPRQQAGHHEELSSYLEECVGKALRNEPQDWILIAVGSEKETGLFLTKFWLKMVKEKKAGDWYLQGAANFDGIDRDQIDEAIKVVEKELTKEQV